MKSLLSRFVVKAGFSLPKNSPIRRFGGFAYRDLARSLEALRELRPELEMRNPLTSSPKTYASWLRNSRRRKARFEGRSQLTRLLIVAEGPSAWTPVFDGASDSIEITVHHCDAGFHVAESLIAAHDLVLVLKQMSRLHQGAVAEIVRAFYDDPEAKLITFDSDIKRGWRRRSPIFRPEWSPDILLGNNYLGRAIAFNARWLEQANVPLDASDRGIWRLALLCASKNEHVHHIPHVLLSESNPTWRNQPTTEDAAMVQEVLDTSGFPCSAEPSTGNLIVTPKLAASPKVSIIVPTRHSRINLSRLLESLQLTEYKHFEIIIVDNGGWSIENENWYKSRLGEFDAHVEWWTEEPFNYNHVNNHGVNISSGEVLVFLNDDTEIVDANWLHMLVGYAIKPGIGEVGFQLLESNGLIQHGGVFIGPGGFADNLFAGLAPHSQTLIGPTDWYRDTLAVTGACVAITRKNFSDVEGFDTNFILMGSDVVLGLSQIVAGRRNLVLPFDMVRHFESVTRGSTVPEQDLYASYWRYHSWLTNGDPYVSPNVSRRSPIPKFARKNEENPASIARRALGRRDFKFIQRGDVSKEAKQLLNSAAVTREDVEAIQRLHQENVAAFTIETVNWFIPEVDMPFFGGINTAFRIANKLRLQNGVKNRFIVLGEPDEMFIRSAVDAAFTGLGTDSEFYFYDETQESLDSIPQADAAVATLWLTALHVARAQCAKRNFYLIQDYEPEFYPASSMFAMAEESYRLGLYGICNTESMFDTYVNDYSGKATYFTPAVDRKIFHPATEIARENDRPVTIFAYARDHFRNCWELVYAALSEIKQRHGRNVKIVVAGARYLPPKADFINLGLMDYRETALHYRNTDIGITMQISRHPSYLPLELMACGVPMISPDSKWFKWLFKNKVNSLESMRSVSDLVQNLETLISDAALRESLRIGALDTVDQRHSNWDDALEGIYPYLCDPEDGSSTASGK